MCSTHRGLSVYYEIVILYDRSIQYTSLNTFRLLNYVCRLELALNLNR